MTLHYTTKEQCPCCSFYTLDSDFDICPVCFWQHDPDQEQDPHAEGANAMTLYEARNKYRQIGACGEHLKHYTRPPLDEERQRP